MPFTIHIMLANQCCCQITHENTQKLLWHEEETHVLDNGHNKVLPSHELPLTLLAHEKKSYVIPSMLEWGQR